MSTYAFPRPSTPLPNGTEWGCDGMTLRDYFAAKALESDFGREDPDYDRSDGNLDYCARLYYRMADAMLKARENNELHDSPAIQNKP